MSCPNEKIPHLDLVRGKVCYLDEVVLKATVFPVDTSDSECFYQWLIELLRYWDSPYLSECNGNRDFHQVCRTWFGLSRNLLPNEVLTHLKVLYCEIQEYPYLTDRMTLIRVLDTMIETLWWHPLNVRSVVEDHLSRYYPDVDRDRLISPELSKILESVIAIHRDCNAEPKPFLERLYQIPIPEKQGLWETQRQIGVKLVQFCQSVVASTLE